MRVNRSSSSCIFPAPASTSHPDSQVCAVGTTCVVAQLRNYATVAGGIGLALIEDGNGTRISPIRERKRRSARMPLGSFTDLRVKEKCTGVRIDQLRSRPEMKCRGRRVIVIVVAGLGRETGLPRAR